MAGKVTFGAVVAAVSQLKVGKMIGSALGSGYSRIDFNVGIQSSIPNWADVEGREADLAQSVHAFLLRVDTFHLLPPELACRRHRAEPVLSVPLPDGPADVRGLNEGPSGR